MPLIQLPSNAPGKVVDDGLSFWVAAMYVGDTDEDLGSWLWFGPD